MDKEKKVSRHSGPSSQAAEHSSLKPGSEMDEIYRKLQPEMRRPKPSAEAIAAALEAAQRLAAEADAEDAAEDTSAEVAADASAGVCSVCGYSNRRGYKFCGMCGVAVVGSGDGETEGSSMHEVPQLARNQNPFLDPNFDLEREGEPEAHIMSQDRSAQERSMQERLPATRPTGLETHHYHHHYHHHYFPGGQDGMAPRSGAEPVRESVREAGRELEKLRPTPALRGDMSRAEAAVRRIAHEWVLACNTKHLDDLLDLYVPDAYVLRSNCPPIRGAAAVREFYFGALDAGLGEVELEPLRVEVIGDLAYEAGRCKALIPGATGKRREERGKYLWVCARQSNGEWKLAADCWSSDLTLSSLESDVPVNSSVKSTPPRKTP